ncbi:MAG: substrate-binding domain-containing protein [Lachnospiraceae bacterium]|nr:substrate-binding domain-containing protein [Lachnospiraceae bacterium]MDE6186225.1 substrate-binding domain-containing protein [Lachnospiraceae bacterium]
MNRNKIYFSLLMLILVIVIGGAVYEMLDAGKEEKPYTVSVIVEDSNNDRWIAMRQGLEQAAQDYNINLNFVFSGEFDDIEEEMELILREVRGGAEGLIIQMISDDEGMEELGEVEAQMAVMLIESDVEPQGVYAVTGPDNMGIGMALGREVMQEIGADSEQKRIGILCGNQKQIAMQQRLAGIEQVLAEKNTEISWVLQGNKADMIRELTVNNQEEPVDIIIALGNAETELAVDYLIGRGEERKENCLLYGVGCSEKAVYYLDKGWIKSLVVPNEFNMGYLSMEEVARQLKYRLSRAENMEVDYLVIDQTNLYEEENQKILFPIVQ